MQEQLSQSRQTLASQEQAIQSLSVDNDEKKEKIEELLVKDSATGHVLYFNFQIEHKKHQFEKEHLSEKINEKNDQLRSFEKQFLDIQGEISSLQNEQKKLEDQRTDLEARNKALQVFVL